MVSNHAIKNLREENDGLKSVLQSMDGSLDREMATAYGMRLKKGTVELTAEDIFTIYFHSMRNDC